MHRYAEGTLGNGENHFNSLQKPIFIFHRYASGTLGMLKNH